MATTPAIDAKMPEIWSLKHLQLPMSLTHTTTGEENKEDDAESIPSDVVDRFQSLFAQVTSDSMVIEHVDKNVVLDEFLLELVGSVVHEHVSVKQAVGLLSSVEFAQSSIASQALTDTLWFWGSQLDNEAIASTTASDSTADAGNASEPWNRLCLLVKEIAGPSLAIDGTLLMTSLSLKLLAGAGIIKDEKFFQGKMKRLLTTMVYKQQKFNLLREETEGYSKLAVILCSLPAPSPIAMTKTVMTTSQAADNRDATTTPTAAADVSRYIDQVLALIGHFDLDANRALDVVLDVFEQQIWNLSFLPLLQQFSRKNIPHILGFKFEFYHAAIKGDGKALGQQEVSSSSAAVGKGQDESGGGDKRGDQKGGVKDAKSSSTPAISTPVNMSLSSSTTPSSLYAIAAVLLAAEVVSLEELLPYLAPTAEETCLIAQRREEALVREIRTHGSSSASAGGSMSALVTAGTLDRPSAIPPLPYGGLPGSSASSGRPPLPGPNQSMGQGMGVTSLPTGVLPGAGFGSATMGVVSSSGSGITRNVSNGSLGGATSAAAGGGDDVDTVAYAEGNQFVGVLSALIALRCLPLAMKMVRLLEEHHVGIDVMQFTVVRDALVESLLWSTDDIYYPVGFKAKCLSGSAEGDMKLAGSLTHTKTSGAAQGSAPSRTVKGVQSSTDSGLRRLLQEQDQDLSISGARRVASSLLGGQQIRRLTSLASFPEDPLVVAWLGLMGHHVNHSAVLFTRLCRLLDAHVAVVAPQLLKSAGGSVPSTSATEKNGSEEHDTGYERIRPALRIISVCLLPALTTGPSSPSFACQLWSTMSKLPFHLRYQLYDSWRGEAVAKDAVGLKHPEVVLAETQILHGTKYQLKRLAKENAKKIGSLLAKLTHQNPLVVYNQVLGQIEAFDNLIPFVVEGIRYSSKLAFDVMSYCIVNQLAKDSEKLKKGDTHYSSWFAALAKFTGSFFRRYYNTDLKGLLHFLLAKLSDGQSLDLLVLKELLGRMGGCDTLLEMSVAQLEGLSGGKTLRAEAMGTVGKAEAKSPIAARALREALVLSETAIPLLLLIAQNRSRILFCTDTPQLKLVSHLYDTAHDVLMQFTDFLVAGARWIEDIAKLMPPMRSLLGETGLAVPVAFQLVRPIMRAALQRWPDPLSMGGGQGDTAAGDSALATAATVSSSRKKEKEADLILRPWHPFGKEMVSAVRDHLLRQEEKDARSAELAAKEAAELAAQLQQGLDPDHVPMTTDLTITAPAPQPSVWSVLSPEIYLLFWSLSLYDVVVPSDKYDCEIRRLRERNKALMTQSAATKNSSSSSSMNMGGAGAQDKAAVKARQDEMTKCLNAMSDLTNEMGEQAKHVAAIRAMVTDQRMSYFQSHLTGQSTDQAHHASFIVDYLMQHCVLDRILMSPVDAVYGTQFGLLLHNVEMPWYSTIQFLHKSVVCITPLVFCSTEAEAGFLGFALNETFKLLNHWMAPQVFADEAMGKRGFLVDSLKSNSKDEGTVGGTSAAGKPSHITLDRFKTVIQHFESKLQHTLLQALSSKEYMHVRSAMIALSKVASTFPATGRVPSSTPAPDTAAKPSSSSAMMPSPQSQVQDIKYFVKIVVPLITKVEAIEKAAGEGQGDQGLQIMARSLAAILRKQHAIVSGEELMGKKTKQQVTSQAAVVATTTSTSQAKSSSSSSSSSSASSSSNSGGHVKPPTAGVSTSGSGVGMGARDGRGEGKGDRGSSGGAVGLGPHGRRDSHDWDRDNRDNTAAAASSNAPAAAAMQQRSSHSDHRSGKGDTHHRDHHHRGVNGDGSGAESRAGDKDKDGQRGGGQQHQQQHQQRGSTGGGHHMDSTGGQGQGHPSSSLTGQKRKGSDLPSSASSSSSSSSNSSTVGGNTNFLINADQRSSVDLRDAPRGGGGSNASSGAVGSGDKKRDRDRANDNRLSTSDLRSTVADSGGGGGGSRADSRERDRKRPREGDSSSSSATGAGYHTGGSHDKQQQQQQRDHRRDSVGGGSGKDKDSGGGGVGKDSKQSTSSSTSNTNAGSSTSASDKDKNSGGGSNASRGTSGGSSAGKEKNLEDLREGLRAQRLNGNKAVVDAAASASREGTGPGSSSNNNNNDHSNNNRNDRGSGGGGPPPGASRSKSDSGLSGSSSAPSANAAVSSAPVRDLREPALPNRGRDNPVNRGGQRSDGGGGGVSNVGTGSGGGGGGGRDGRGDHHRHTGGDGSRGGNDGRGGSGGPLPNSSRGGNRR